MTTRVLPPAEWPRLTDTELDSVWPFFDPTKTTVVVVEDGPVIVACWALLVVLHAECVWIHPDYRKRAHSPALRLLRGMQQAARAQGAQTVVTAAMTPEVESLIARIGGTELQGRHYVLSVGG